MSRQSTLLRFFSKAPPAGTEPRSASGERNGLHAAGSPPGGAGRAAARRGENGEEGAGGGAAAKAPKATRYRRGRGRGEREGEAGRSCSRRRLERDLRVVVAPWLA